MIAFNAHELVCHSGVTSTSNFIRSKFWIFKERQTVKKILKKCFICKYVNRKILLGPATPCLPNFRIKCNQSFELVGAHFAGPIYYKVKSSVYKACVLLFTGGVARASNIELRTDQSFQFVILTSRRFLPKRGKTKLVISDNFQTFKSTELKNFLQNNSIEWEVILERSSWWGGFYEIMIGITKLSFKKGYGQSCTYILRITNYYYRN